MPLAFTHEEQLNIQQKLEESAFSLVKQKSVKRLLYVSFLIRRESLLEHFINFIQQRSIYFILFYVVCMIRFMNLP